MSMKIEKPPVKYNLPVEYDRLRAEEKRIVREQYVKEQNGLCWFCARPLNEKPANKVENATINIRLFPPGFFTHPIHLQHDHNTGLTEGAVHARCNAYLWEKLGR